MFLKMDNKGAVDIANSWSVVGWTRYIDVRQCFPLERKEEGLLQIKHVPRVESNVDLFTNNLPGPTLKKHVQMCYGINKYSKNGKVLKAMWDLHNPWVREVVSRSKWSMLRCFTEWWIINLCNESCSSKKVLSHAWDWNYNNSNRSRTKLKIIIWKSSLLLSGLLITAKVDGFWAFKHIPLTVYPTTVNNTSLHSTIAFSP